MQPSQKRAQIELQKFDIQSLHLNVRYSGLRPWTRFKEGARIFYRPSTAGLFSLGAAARETFKEMLLVGPHNPFAKIKIPGMQSSAIPLHDAERMAGQTKHTKLRQWATAELVELQDGLLVSLAVSKGVIPAGEDQKSHVFAKTGASTSVPASNFASWEYDQRNAIELLENDKVVREFASQKHAAQALAVSQALVSRHMNGFHTTLGLDLRWKIPDAHSGRFHGSNTGQAVVQLDEGGQVIRRFESQRRAALSLGVSGATVALCISGRRINTLRLHRASDIPSTDSVDFSALIKAHAADTPSTGGTHSPSMTRGSNYDDERSANCSSKYELSCMPPGNSNESMQKYTGEVEASAEKSRCEETCCLTFLTGSSAAQTAKVHGDTELPTLHHALSSVGDGNASVIERPIREHKCFDEHLGSDYDSKGDTSRDHSREANDSKCSTGLSDNCNHNPISLEENSSHEFSDISENDSAKRHSSELLPLASPLSAPKTILGPLSVNSGDQFPRTLRSSVGRRAMVWMIGPCRLLASPSCSSQKLDRVLAPGTIFEFDDVKSQV